MSSTEVLVPLPTYKMTYAVFYDTGDSSENVAQNCGEYYATEYLGKFIHAQDGLVRLCRLETGERTLSVVINNVAIVRLTGRGVRNGTHRIGLTVKE